MLSFNQCLSQGGGGGCSADAALVVGARAVAVAPDGRFVYLSGGSGINGYLRAYARDGLTGTLNPLGCLTYLAIPGCSTAAGMANTDKLAISPDGRNLYLTAFEGGDGGGAVAAFRIQTAPSCQSGTANVVAGASVSIPLACSDAAGDPISRAIATPPGKGTLGAIDQAAGTVTYTANATASGADAFTFTASDGTNVSAPATVTITITPRGGTPPSVTHATQSNRSWRRGNHLASFAKAHKPPIGTTFSFTLNEPASVSFAFTQKLGGRKVKSKCVAQTKRNRHKPACQRTVTRGTLRFTGHAGTNKVSFQGRISASKKLGLGRYTLVITATNAAGQRSSPQSLSFTIVK